MEDGYIYILSNVSLKGLLKIGSTTFGAAKRAKQLSYTTSLPTPFIVEYEVFVKHYVELEKAVHEKLASFRLNSKREFFEVSIDKAIQVIENFRTNPYYQSDDKYSAIEILPKLQTKYGSYIDPNIVSARIYQKIDRVYFEYTKYEYISNYLKDQIIKRIDLGFIINDTDISDKTFKEIVSVEINARIFLNLDDLSMASCVGDIFIHEWFLK